MLALDEGEFPIFFLRVQRKGYGTNSCPEIDHMCVWLHAAACEAGEKKRVDVDAISVLWCRLLEHNGTIHPNVDGSGNCHGSE